MDVLRFAIIGVSIGSVYSLIALGIVATHRGSGVLNFAQAAIGMFGTFVAFELQIGLDWPVVPSFLVGVAVSAAIAAAHHLLVMKRLIKAALATRIVATLGLMIGLIGVANLLFQPTGDAVAVPAALPDVSVNVVGDIYIGLDRILTVVIAVVATVALVLVQRRTRLGLATAAVAEDTVIAASMGLSPNVVAAVNWAIGGVVGMVGVYLVTPIGGLESTNLTMLIIPAMAAALIGRFESFLITLVSGVAIGILQSETSLFVENRGWSTAVPLLVIIVILVTRGTYIPGKAESSQRVAKVGPGRIGPQGIVLTVAGLALILLTSLDWLTSSTLSLLFAMVALSVVVVSGYAGQISLMQLSLAGMSAYFTAFIVAKTELPMWMAIVIAALATVLLGMVVAVPALRTRGSNLAIASLGMAAVIDALVLDNGDAVAMVSEQPMRQLSLFGIGFDSFENPRNFAILCVVVLALCLAAIANVRRGISGRRLLAVRSNERAAMALGISVPGAKIYAFALGAFVAGLAGAMLEAQLLFADFTLFTVLGSIEVLLSAVLGGIGSPSGALVGGAISNGGAVSQAMATFVPPGNWLLAVSGFMAIVVVLQSADGLVPLWIDQARWLVRKLLPGRGEPRRGRDKPLDVAAPSGEQRAKFTVDVRGATVRFGGQLALDDVSVEIRPGEILGLIGPNGAGKSTFIDVVSGFIRPQHGTVTFDTEPVNGLSPTERSRKGVVRSFQNLELFEDMTIRDNIRTAADDRAPSRYLLDVIRPQNAAVSPVAAAAIRDFGLAEHMDQYPADVDFARRRLVAIARAMAAEPAALLLDEPAAGLDATGRAELSSVLREVVQRSGVGVLLVEHDVDLVFSLCDRVVALDSGRVIAAGSPQEVRADPDVIAAYLGPQFDDRSEPVGEPTTSGKALS
ncbi:ATP-binding cassette domain-containing protein [Saccharopolyspora sp. ASAGF58]|uniref:ABC transporter permease subunit n=1 Tax=Saccharopolyspora sp. ASAGF58 TaxID=2719023 RepID=UPI001440062C|nr:ATP-binding cassette domain-containing protein [Saccharopolyspora sp. ASAGF58]QIZ38017.1 ATP-binding cassette domain-containing protein [Saccharopolyspora sp. ASAGF58]